MVSCKSWQVGFDPKERIAAIEESKIREGRDAWKSFRELAKKKWADGMMQEIERLTGSAQFTYVTAVTKLNSGAEAWNNTSHSWTICAGIPSRF